MSKWVLLFIFTKLQYQPELFSAAMKPYGSDGHHHFWTKLIILHIH